MGADENHYLTAAQVSELSEHKISVAVVRQNLRTGALASESFPELGKRSNRRVKLATAQRWVELKLTGNARPSPATQTTSSPGAGTGEHEPKRAATTPTATDDTPGKLLDTTLAVKASLSEVIDAVVDEAEHRITLAAAQLASEKAHLRTIKRLAAALNALNTTLTGHVIPDSPTINEQLVSPQTDS